ncbi:MAG TPA: carbonic anhydrase [Deltaproteobacteria bacterium]|jgi:carbonic anhydrase|nr:carbonic anhydrase [Pseudomonadota bacterium]HBM52833.1 carbonic anhydrase [Deltaproteobacteria bacterium]|tara:strand:+ start:7226 stop:7837 length:612 start_codon:yes stop_codon:yes gene_type:complete
MLTAQEALTRLQEGNKRFVEGKSTYNTNDTRRRNELVDGQTPFAIILGCSDSRVPAEIVFDQGLGDLFVIRIAGNIVAPSQIGSIEFAVETFQTPLVVVLGHTRCGAVAATLNQIRQPQASRSQHLRSIVERIRPAVEPLSEIRTDLTPEQLLERAIRSNIRMSVNQLRHGSSFLEEIHDSGSLWIVGAEYSLESGEVDFFES